jgi:tripartite-type tricarboxylate transporter receptor subunit TctC
MLKVTKVCYAHLFLALICVFFSLQSAKAAYPERNITLVVPFSPGGGNDAIARVVGDEVSKIFDKPVVIENRPGAGGTIGTAVVAKAKPDGYTLLLISPAHAINAYVLKSLPYHALSDFTAISQLTRSAYVLVATPESKLNSVDDIKAAALKLSRPLRIATPGIGSAPYLAAAVLSSSANLKATLVPYQGGAPALTGLLRGDVDMYFSSFAGARGFLESKKLNAIAVTSDRRIKALPDTPTLAEAGVPDFAINGWYGIIGPANMPKNVVQKLNVAISRAMKAPSVITKIEMQGEEPVGSSAEDFEVLLHREYKYYGAVTARTGLKPH